MLREILRKFFYEQGVEKTYWIAYSGGLDSHVLLSACHSLQQEINFNINVVHINHGISQHAMAWAEHCKQICHHYQVNYIERKLQIDVTQGNIEESARKQRYAVLAELMQAEDILLTAHHQDDQAETFLLQLLRGAGLKGLSAMPVIKPFAQGYHARPFLTISRADIHIYAKNQNLQWIDDESNANRQFSRNFIRHDILPLIQSRWSSASHAITRSATHCAEAQILLEEFAQKIIADVRGAYENTLSVKKLLQFNLAQQRLIIRTWIHSQGYSLPDAKKLTTIMQDVLHAEWDRLPCVFWQETELRRYRDDLFLMQPIVNHDSQQSYDWDFKDKLSLSNVGILQAQISNGKGIRTDISNVKIGFRQGGEMANLHKRGNHTLKNLFQEWNVLPWERNRIPLFFIGERLIGVLGYFIDNEFAAGENEAGWEIRLES